MSNHIDEFIDEIPKPNEPEIIGYARFFFEIKRMPAYKLIEYNSFIKELNLTLFCEYNNKKYKVTGCSSLGDVWLHDDLDYSGESYKLRVNIDDLKNFSRN